MTVVPFSKYTEESAFTTACVAFGTNCKPVKVALNRCTKRAGYFLASLASLSSLTLDN